MGIEYRHFIVVNDADWRPQNDTFSRVDAVLRKWLLVERPEKFVDLRKGVEISETETSAAPDLAFVYAGVGGTPVERIAGPSAYEDVAAADRYTMNTALAIGDDYHIQWSSEAIYFELVSPPAINGVPIAGVEDRFFGTLFSESFPSDEATTPPVVKAHVADHATCNVAWKSYLGYWRAGIVIDFGKDLPSFTEDLHTLPAQDLVTEIGRAFRAPVVEIGEFY